MTRPPNPHRGSAGCCRAPGIGALALAGTLVGVGTLAGAQDAPEPEPAESAEAEPFDDRPFDDRPFDDEAWEGFETCIDGQLGTAGEPGDEAEGACEDQLPAEIQAEMASWEAFDECLDEQLGELGDLQPVEFGAVVHVEGPEGFEMIEFGEGQGTVTIVGNADDVSVTSDGDVTVFTEADLDAEWEAFDEAHEACEQHLED